MSKTLTVILIGMLGAAVAVGALAQDAPPPERGDGPPPEKARAARGGGDFFARHDLDGDGKVTLDELCAPAKKTMKELDADADGAITKEEFEAHRKKMMEERKAARDARGEAKGGGERRGPRGDRPSPEDVFRRLDTDGDGSLSLEEFSARPERPRRRGR